MRSFFESSLKISHKINTSSNAAPQNGSAFLVNASAMPFFFSILRSIESIFVMILIPIKKQGNGKHLPCQNHKSLRIKEIELMVFSRL